MEVALIKNITTTVIFKLTLKVQVPFWVSILLQLMTMCRPFSIKRKQKMLEVDETKLKL